MWPPSNIQSFPSKKEIQRAKEEISIIKPEIIETELRIDALKKPLSERKTRIAPIRTIPSEIMSLIFIEASRTDWKAPLVLQSVSRQWRDVVVNSSEAWTFIPLSKCSRERRSELISLFLERSRNKPLHIFVEDDSLLRYMEILAGRIECIYLDMSSVNRYLQRGHTFHRLERLKIVGAWEVAPPTDPAAWNMPFFPNLQTLDIRSSSVSLLRAISASPGFPAIRHLTVWCLDLWTPLDILTKWAASLQSVNLTYGNLPFGGLDTVHKIHFPRLRYMRLGDVANRRKPRFRLKAATPNLQEYLDSGDISILNAVEVDTGSVVLLDVSRTPDLSRYPRLATLCLTGHCMQGEEVIEATKCLRDNPALCPDLALIEYTTELTEEQMAKAKDALMARGEVNGHIIQLTMGTPKVQAERMHALRGVETCGDHMPCKVSI